MEIYFHPQQQIYDSMNLLSAFRLNLIRIGQEDSKINETI